MVGLNFSNFFDVTGSNLTVDDNKKMSSVVRLEKIGKTRRV